MANYKVEFDSREGTITKTLTFMGKEYYEVWEEENSFCKCGLEALVDKDNPDLQEEIM